MKLPAFTLAAHIGSVIVLVAIGRWIGSDGGSEPVVALIVAIGTYLGTGYRIIVAMTGGLSMDVDIPNESHLFEVIPSVVNKLPAYDQAPVGAGHLFASTDTVSNNISKVSLAIFRNLGLLSISNDGSIKPVSERAAAFIKSMSYSMEPGVNFLGDWSAEGAGNTENNKLKKVLMKAEQFRISKSGNEAKPSREVESSIVIIKTTMDGVDRYLMQWSEAWSKKGYYWFIGGLKESSDLSIEACAYRELHEELGLERPAVKNLIKLGAAVDNRISSRVGAYSSYKYTVYCAILNRELASVKEIHKPEFMTKKSVNWTTHSRKNRWLTWSEILGDENLKNDATPILDLLEQIGEDEISYNSGLKLS